MDALQDFGEVTQSTIVDVVEWLSYHFYQSGWKESGGSSASAGQFCGMLLYQSIPDDESNASFTVVPVSVTLYQYPSVICPAGDSYSWRLIDDISTAALPSLDVGQQGVIFYAGYAYPRRYKFSYFKGDAEYSLPSLSYLYFDFNRSPVRYTYQNGDLLPFATSAAYIPASSYYNYRGAIFTNVSTPSSVANTTVYSVPLTPDTTYSYDDYYVIMESALTQINDDTRLNVDTPIDIPSLLPTDYNDFVALMESTEPTEETGGGCCCGCTVYVDADGNVIINNDGDSVTNFNVDSDATLEANITAAAGAFGAGAIVIDADANVNLQALAGAFGAGAISVNADGSIVVNVAAGGFASGAFGAGAIVNPEINISGEVSGSVSIGATDVNVNVSGGDVSFQQSGTVNNYYYYYDSTEPTEEPFTIDYDEIMSPSEFFDIMDYTNDWAEYPDTIPADTVPFLPAETLPLSVVGVAAPVADVVSQIISDSGLMPLLAPVSVISFYLHFLER